MRKRLLSVLLLLVVFLCCLPASIFKPKFALVLSGGGAKGIAHIPILEELDRRGIVPDMVLGTSMGAIIGGFYASGYSGEELEELVRETDLMGYFLHLHAIRSADTLMSPFTAYDTNLLTVEFGASGLGATNGLVDDQYINGFIRRNLSKVLGIRDFDDLPIPYRAIGTDITNSRKVVFSAGSLFDAIRASMAIPVVFSPVRLDDGSYIMDGGLEDNMPTDIARDLGADIVLAVDVNDARHIYGENRNDMATLSGTFSQFSDYLTGPNSSANYDEADWVIVPDTTDYSALSFGSTDGILEAGEKAVQDYMYVFDELESRLERWIPDMEAPDYESIPAPVISRIIAGNDAIPSASMHDLQSFEGMEMDTWTMADFEKALDDIRRHEGLMSVTYEIDAGIISVYGERYPSLSGSIHLGLTGSIGIRYTAEDGFFFAYTPDFTVSGRMALIPRLDLTYGIVVGDGTTIDAGLAYPFLSSAFLYGRIGLQYGELSHSSIPGTPDYRFGSDLGLFLNIGVGYLPLSNLRLDAIFGTEYACLFSEGGASYVYPYIGLGLVYDGYDGTNASDNGLDASLTLEFGGDFPDNTISYAFSAEAFGAFGPTDIFKFIFDFSTATIRRPIELASAYSVTKMGMSASDSIFLMGGFRLPLPYSIFVDAGIFFEAFGGSYDELSVKGSRSLVPYSELMLSEDGMDIGGCFSAGIATSFGQVSLSFYVSAVPRISLMVNLK